MVEEESSVEAFKDFTINDAGGSKPSSKDPAEQDSKPKKQEPKPEQQQKQQPQKESKPEPPKKEESTSSTTTSSSSTPDFGGPILASPIARRMALERGIPLKQLKGTGPGGRIIKSDIEKYQPPSSSTTGLSAPQTAATGAQQGQGYTDIPLTGMRKTIAKRLSESMFTAPHYYLTSSINMTKTLKLRLALNEAATQGKDGKKSYKLSVNDFIVKAVGVALQRVPEANSQWLENEGVLRLFSYVDISVWIPGPLPPISPICLALSLFSGGVFFGPLLI
jgi:pyruvate dehydrogenase E2 component (dihydrolipoamide acetyltransferase)